MSEFTFPTSLQYKMCPVDDRSSSATLIQILIWLLQHKILLQYHTYIYFMPSGKGLVSILCLIILILVINFVIDIISGLL